MMESLYVRPKPNVFSAQNKDIVTILQGQPVAIHSSGSGVVLASASLNGMSAVGLASKDIAVGASGDIQTDLSITLANWTNIIGSANLASKADYFLSGTAGSLTITAPSVGFVQRVLREISPVIGEINLSLVILL